DRQGDRPRRRRRPALHGAALARGEQPPRAADRRRAGGERARRRRRSLRHAPPERPLSGASDQSGEPASGPGPAGGAVDWKDVVRAVRGAARRGGLDLVWPFRLSSVDAGLAPEERVRPPGDAGDLGLLFASTRFFWLRFAAALAADPV